MQSHVLFHIDENQKWDLALANITNLLEAMGSEKVVIEAVANSVAIEFYKGNENKGKLEPLLAKGVIFCACNNSMKALGIKKEDMIAFVKVVPAGVKELLDRQKEGYAYIKP